MEKILLKCHLSPGDIVMLTAAVRDLHIGYPGRFQTDVRTSCPDLWLHNPHVTPLDDSDPSVRVIDCQYPLINRCNTSPYHCLQGFIEFLNEQLDLQIRLRSFKGDIHLSLQEKAWYSQIHELAGIDLPFWIIDAGGKYDVTVKWWATERYQKVVDSFRGKILFVQVGGQGHHHPKLKGVVDLRGRTSLRMLARLVFHAHGVLCPVTALMHLAAAIESKPGIPELRPCVVVAGGREPPHWEAYPGHQFLHTVGALTCCAQGGCWRDRVEPLGDGDPRDRPERLCSQVVSGLPRCLDMIGSEEVIKRIEQYYEGGLVSYLSTEHRSKARQAIRKTAKNPFEQLPLTSANARIECERFVRKISASKRKLSGKGIVICAGGSRLFANAWVSIQILRQLGCQLPIQVWHLGPGEMDSSMIDLLKPLGVECVDALRKRRVVPSRRLGGWELKPYAILNSPFAEVLLLDADNVAVRNPEFLFDTKEYREAGAVFWPDLGQLDKTQYVWDLLGLIRPAHPEFESGQMLINKVICWRALTLAMWLNENSDFFYRHLHGDKETFHLAFRKVQQPFAFVSTPITVLPGTMCQHDLQGRRLFQHRNTDKWSLFANNPIVTDFWLEEDCRKHLRHLQTLWTGSVGKTRPPLFNHKSTRTRFPTLRIGMISCGARNKIREQTLNELLKTDWGDDRSLILEMDDGIGQDPKERLTKTTRRLLQRFGDADEDYLIFLEDDLAFNQHLRHNLMSWRPLSERLITFASIYNPGVREEGCEIQNRAYLVRPEVVYGSQALLLSRKTVEYILGHWDDVTGMPDIKMPRLAGRLNKPIYYHSPSLVQHVGQKSTWGGGFHQASDFDPIWRNIEPQVAPYQELTSGLQVCCKNSF